MKLAMRNPMWPSHMHEMFEKFFNESFATHDGANFLPQTDVVENEQAYELQLAVPGFPKDSFKLAVENRTLTISGERKFREEKKEARYHQIETSYGRFARSFRLPENVNVEGIEASYADGVLHVTLPKQEPTKLITEINVK